MSSNRFKGLIQHSVTFNLTPDAEASMKRSVHSHQVDGLDVVAVHDLQLVPGDRSGLTLQQVQPWCQTQAEGRTV